MPRPPLHPDVTALMTAASAAPPLGSLPPAAMRDSYAAARRALAGPVQEVAAVEDLTIAGPGGPLPLRLYRGSVTDGPSPCLLFLHGGGWVLGGLDTHDAICRHLATGSNGAVLSVDYRLAPEHPFPAAVEDGMAALHWLAGQAGALGLDSTRLAVGGDSAGGNLAAVLALMGRDGTVPRTVFQLLFYPVTDMRMTGESYAANTAGVPLTADAMGYFIGHYVPDTADRTDWRASPLLAPDLSGAPPAFLLTCGHDPLCSEGQAYAAWLDAHGVPVITVHLPDQAHGILNLGRAIGATPGLLDFAAATLKDAWRPRPVLR